MTDTAPAGAIVDDTFGAGYSVWSIPDESAGRPAVLIHEYGAGDRLRHVQWLDPAAAVELGHRLIETAQPLAGQPEGTTP